MSRLSLKAVLITCTAVSMSFAQNARIDAMGGVSVIDDIGAVIAAPADMNDFKDQVQATGNGAGFGPYIGIKSLGDVVSLGVVGNRGLVLDEFYGAAIGAVNSGLGEGAPAIDDVPEFPHILLGLDFDALTLGIDLFMEMAGTSYFQDVDGDETTESGRVSNFGAIVNANIALGNDMLLSPVFGISFPGINQETETPDDVTSELSSESGLYMTLGTEFGMQMFDASWFVGLFWSMEKFQFADEVNDTEGDINTNNSIDGYLGFSSNVLNNLLFVGEYAIGLSFSTGENEDADTKNTASNVSHRFASGLEKPVEGFWIFDQLIGRAGVVLTINDQGTKNIDEDADTETRTSSPADISQVTPTLGLGLTKGLFQFDILTNLSGWTGLIAGPPVVEGTVTLNFGGSSPDPVYEPTPSYNPAPSSEPAEEEPMEEEGESDFSF